MKNRPRRSWRSPTLAIFVLLTPACGSEADPSQLIEADRAFNEAVAAGGSEAWTAWFAEDGAIVQSGVGEIRGTERIRTAVPYLDDPNVSLTWQPARADIAASGDLGWTTGSFVLRTRGPDGAVTHGNGIYVSIWRRQADGSWKVVMDLGNPVDEDAGTAN